MVIELFSRYNFCTIWHDISKLDIDVGEGVDIISQGMIGVGVSKLRGDLQSMHNVYEISMSNMVLTKRFWNIPSSGALKVKRLDSLIT